MASTITADSVIERILAKTLVKIDRQVDRRLAKTLAVRIVDITALSASCATRNNICLTRLGLRRVRPSVAIAVSPSLRLAASRWMPSLHLARLGRLDRPDEKLAASREHWIACRPTSA